MVHEIWETINAGNVSRFIESKRIISIKLNILFCQRLLQMQFNSTLRTQLSVNLLDDASVHNCTSILNEINVDNVEWVHANNFQIASY